MCADHNIIPIWVHKEQFIEILKVQFDNFTAIKSFTVTAALNDGENYITQILRIEITVELEPDSFATAKYILKIPLQNAGNDSAKNPYHDLFVFEEDMYTNVVPELEKMFADIASMRVKFSAKCFRFQNAPNCDYILMEDLQARGFRNENRLVGMNELQTKQVLAKLAQWHAASAKRVEVKGNYSADYMESYFGDRDLIASMNAAFTKPFLECLEADSYADLADYKEIIQKYSQKIDGLYEKFGKVQTEEFNVLNHGDFWMNNFMFQYIADSETSKECYFVDYQLPKYGNIAQDLHCLLITSVCWDIKLSHFDAFVKYYHERLIENLNILQYTKMLPTLAQLQESLRVNGVWAFVCAQRMLAVTLLDPLENSNIETFMSDNAEGMAFKKRMFLNPRYIKQMVHILPWLIREGYMDAT